jgi:uncharacterized spore protein YtfJ
MKVQEVLEQARDALSVKRVFGEAYERDGVTVIPAATFAGGGGGGGDNRPEGGSGGGFGLAGKPAGAYVIRDGVVSWQPALDLNRIVTVSSVVFLALLLFLRSMMRTRARVKRAKLRHRS